MLISRVKHSLSLHMGMHHTDSELILGFQQGKYSNFELLYEQNLQKVYRYLIFKTNGNKTLAQDLCSEAFLAGFEALERFQVDEHANFWARMISIAHHKRVDYLRAHHEEELSLDEELVPAKKSQILDLLELEAKTKEILVFLEGLGTEKRDIITLRLRDELNYNEIAPLLGKSEEACRQLFSRTMKTLCDHFWK